MTQSIIQRYGASFPSTATALEIEMGCIRKGGKWTSKAGVECGMGLSYHFERMRNILWPDLDDHRWNSLCRDEILKNKVTVLMGPKSCGKTHYAAWIYLCEYLCFPEETCVLVCSTHIDGLRLRVWGEICNLWQAALDQYDFLPGNLLDSKLLISTDKLAEDAYDERRVRDWRKGIKGVPCLQNGKFVGLSKFIGLKQKRVRLIADEAPLMGLSFLNSFANLDGNEDFKAIILGNPNDMLDPLGKAAEPVDGWANHMEPTKTEVWKTRFMDGTCVNLVGTDSPNFDYPQTEPTRYKYLISREKIANTLSFFPKDSLEFYSQCMGVMKIGQMNRRVITRDICRQFRASDDVVWKGTGTIRVYALDAAYGGDRCVGGWGEFGEDVTGKTILYIHQPKIIPIIVGGGSPEDQIALRVREDCIAAGIPPENMGHDSTGRGSLGTAIARVWSALTNPVEFGGAPTDRPVSKDMHVTDSKTGVKRLKTCKEHYSKFVTELWFSVRYAIEASQIRGLTEEVMDEGCMREWRLVKGDKYEVESKDDMKLRTGRSPDFFDWVSILVEMARRKGFSVAKMANVEFEVNNTEWIEDLRDRAKSLQKNHRLDYKA